MNVYNYIDTMVEAVRTDAAVLAYCITNFKKGLMLHIDDDAEGEIGERQAPYCLFMSTPGGDDSIVAESMVSVIRVEVGTLSANVGPYLVTSVERTATANGVAKYAQGEKCVDLLDLILAAIKAVNFSDCAMLETSSIDASGSLFFPLALAVTNLSISKYKSTATL